jgi:hypothetical protein
LEVTVDNARVLGETIRPSDLSMPLLSCKGESNLVNAYVEAAHEDNVFYVRLAPDCLFEFEVLAGQTCPSGWVEIVVEAREMRLFLANLY